MEDRSEVIDQMVDQFINQESVISKRLKEIDIKLSNDKSESGRIYDETGVLLAEQQISEMEHFPPRLSRSKRKKLEKERKRIINYRSMIKRAGSSQFDRADVCKQYIFEEKTKAAEKEFAAEEKEHLKKYS